MSQLAPPRSPPLVALDEGGNLRRLRFGLWLVFWTAITILITAWACTFGWIPAIIAILIAKHVLVALLVVGLGVDNSRRAEE
jgi:hypothetical protein